MESVTKSLEKIVKPRDMRPPARLSIGFELNLSRPASGVGALQQNAGNLAVQRFLQPEFLQARRTRQANDRDSEVTDPVMPAEPETSSGAQSIAPEPTRPIEQKRVISRMAGDKLFNASPDIAEETPELPAASAPRAAKPRPSFPAGSPAPESAVEAAEGKETAPPSGADEKAPLTPEKDTAHQAVVAQVGIRGKQEKTPTKKPEEKRDETLRAANLETQDITATQDSYGKHLNKLKQAQPHELTVKGFMDEFKATVEELAKKLPQDREKHGTDVSAVEVATGKIDAKQKITNQNKKQEAPLQTELATQPSTYAEKTKQDVASSELKVDPAGAIPSIKEAKAAAAKPKSDKAISLDDQSRALDDLLANHNIGGQTVNIDEGSLAFPVSGEKSFDEAGETKRKAQEEVKKARPRYRQEEGGVITKSQGDVHSVVHVGLGNYHGSRAASFDKVLAAQQSHKKNIKQDRQDCFAGLQKIYDETKDNVKTELAAVEKPQTIDETFEAILNKAQAAFEGLVRNDLEYIYTPGVLDYSDWIDIHAKEVNEEYEKLKRLKGGERRYYNYAIDPLWLEARRIVQDRSATLLFRYAKDRFISHVMVAVEEQIATRVVNALNAAKKRIKEGEDKFDKAYDALDPLEKKEAVNVRDAIKGQFGQLRESVDERQKEIIGDMARTYNKSVGQLQSKFDEIKKDVLTSWLEKAWNKIKAVVNAIIEFATRIAELLGKMIGLLGDIISSPRAFFRNLATGIAEGFSEFGRRIDEFLATAFFDWIRGTSGVTVQFPKEWNAAGIFSLFTQLLNLSTETIWQRMEVVYDKTVANAFRRGEVLLDKGLEIFDIIKRDGLGGLWDHIVESLGTLLSDTLDEMKETVLYAAIKKVFIEIGKMLIPGGGFIAIAEKVIRLVVFIVEARNKILDLIEAFVLSMENAVKGDIAGIVKRVTSALTKFITVALDFLVAFFGLSDLKAKVERFIERMRSPIIRGIDFVLQKFKPLVMKGKEIFEKGKEKVVASGKAVVQVGVPEDPNERLRLAARASVSAAKRLTGRVTQGLLNPILGGIKLRYGLTAIQPYEKGGSWWVRASINPDIDQDLGVPGEKAEQGGADVLEAANRALAKELQGVSSRAEAERIVGGVAQRLRPEGLNRLEIGQESAEGEGTIYADAGETRPLGRLIRQALEQSQDVPRNVTVRTAAALKLARAVTVPTGFIGATHPGRRATGGIWLPSDTGTEVRLVSWNVTALTSANASDHAEDQLVKELRQQKDVLQNVETITLQNFHLSPCDDCCGELSKLLSEIRTAQAGNPKLKTAEIYWQNLYAQPEKFKSHSATQTTWDGIRKLSGRGWTIHASPTALPLQTGQIPKDIYERYVYKKNDTVATIKPAIDLSTPSPGSVQRRSRR